MTSHFALVLPGAVARGAFEAGVIEVLADRDMRIDRIVATSSGALNGIAYAAGIRSGREKEMAAKLVGSWVEDGGWENSLSLTPWAFLTGRGLSNNENLLRRMRALITPCTVPSPRPVELRIIVTPLNGIIGAIGRKPATSYERLLKFSDSDFDSAEGLERMFNAVTAACAFPGLFKPVEISGLGACVDGGAVNNAPIKYALDENDVNRVIMPIPFPAIMPPGDARRGASLLNHLVEILINERLYRDLKNAQVVNDQTDRLQQMVADRVLTQAQFDTIASALSIRKVEITEVRPSRSLKGSTFSGFFKKQDRMQLVDDGRRAALETLARIPEHNPTGEQTT